MPIHDEKTTSVTGQDIVFDCAHCGKSLAIDYRGAGLSIHCPGCNRELQVPIPEGVDLSDIDRQLETSGTDEGGGTADYQQAAAITSSSGEQIRLLMTELEELRFRRRFLEKERADSIRWLQAMSRQLKVMRTAMDQLDDILNNLTNRAADDTQKLG